MTVVAFKKKDVENVNPLDYFYRERTQKIAIVLRESFRFVPAFIGLSDSFWEKQAEIYAKEILENNLVSIPNEWKRLFDCKTKKEQEKVLKGISITPPLLISLPVYAYSLGYLYSEYFFEYDPIISHGKIPPIMAVDNNDGLEVYGTTNMTEGEIRSSIRQTKHCFAHLMSKGDVWFCIFSSKRGIMGGEPGYYGRQPHLHFISDKFGVTRSAFVSKFKLGEASSSIHIILKDYTSSD